MVSLPGTASSSARWGLDPPQGLGVLLGVPCASLVGAGSPWGLSAWFDLPCLRLEQLLFALGVFSVGTGRAACECQGTRCPQPATAPVPGSGGTASRELKRYPRKRECSCFNYLAAVRTWCGGN